MTLSLQNIMSLFSRLRRCRRGGAAFAVVVAVMIAFMATAPCFAASLRPEGTAEKLGYRQGDSIAYIPARVRQIPDFCFAGCEGLRRVVFEEGSQCAVISDYAFAYCEDLEEIEVPPTLAGIKEGAFRGCRSLRTLQLPDRIQIIPKSAFADCRSLDLERLPASLREIGALAFVDCASLTLDSIPRGVSKIGNNAFARCFALSDIVLPARCEEVGSYAFADCINLRRLVLPARCRMLGELIVSGCRSLRLIESPALVPPSVECASSLFEPDDDASWRDCRVIVPRGRVDAYRRSAFWERFENITD